MGLFDFLSDIGSGIIAPLEKLFDVVSTTDEEKLTLRNKLTELELAYKSKLIEQEAQILQVQSNIIIAETKGESWLQRNWRPITMITFLILIVGDSLGLLAYRLASEAWTVLQIGLGGYVVGRSGEKIVKVFRDKK